MRSLLVIGFGPFLDITDNPSTRLAEAVDGALDGRIVGRTMPVSYARSHTVTRELIEVVAPDVVLGVGVARSRSTAMLERCARAACNDVPDVDGVCGTLDGDDRFATLPHAFVATLDVGDSEDAGRYVCNAWLYATLAVHPRVGFLHIPPDGFPAERLIDAWRASTSS